MHVPHAIPRFPDRLAPFDLRSTPLLRTDVLVLGSGIAGACAALHAADAGAHVLLLAKDELLDTNTGWAQGGIAVVTLAEDSVETHVADTLRVGAGIASPQVVRKVVHAATDAVDWLVALGAQFDRQRGNADGALELSREGGHSHARVVHSNGDATGREIQRALAAALTAHPRVTVRSQAFVRDLVMADGRCVGAVGLHEDTEIAVEAGAVIVATGGTGQIYRETTNPPGATGDGHALCFRAGARMADCEFVQFHPTTLYIAGASRFLVSEVVRGAGAVLRDRNGERFMAQAHPMAELAPRDVVSRAILARMVATNDTHVYLDLSTVKGDPRSLFPSIARICSTFDLDLARDPIPVRPGAHYFVGGVVVDASGCTTVPGLFACGEVAASGLHGANRLASNSLLEGAVLGRTTGLAAAQAARGPRLGLPRRADGPAIAADPPRLLHDDLLYSLKSLMWRQVGLVRDAHGLTDARARIAFWHHYLVRAPLVDRRTCQLANMLTVSAMVAEAALRRTESRGTHFRNDFTNRDDAGFCRRIFLERAADGSVQTQLSPNTAPTDRLPA